MGLKRKTQEVEGSSTSSSSSSSSSSSNSPLKVPDQKDSSTSNSSEFIEEQQIDPQIAYIKRSHLASRALFDIARHEVGDIDVRKHDFAASDISFSSVLQAIHPSGPEDDARSMKQTALITSAEALVTICKVAELFLMDLALKSWQAKDLSPVPTSVVHAVDAHSISQVNVIRAVRSHDELDFLAETVHKDPSDTFLSSMQRSVFVPKPISGLTPNFFIPAGTVSSGGSSSSSSSSGGGAFMSSRPYASAAAAFAAPPQHQLQLQPAQVRFPVRQQPSLPSSKISAPPAFPVVKIRKQYNTKRRQAEAAAAAAAAAAFKAARMEDKNQARRTML